MGEQTQQMEDMSGAKSLHVTVFPSVILSKIKFVLNSDTYSQEQLNYIG